MPSLHPQTSPGSFRSTGTVRLIFHALPISCREQSCPSSSWLEPVLLQALPVPLLCWDGSLLLAPFVQQLSRLHRWWLFTLSHSQDMEQCATPSKKLPACCLCLGSHQLLKELLQKAALPRKTETVTLTAGSKAALHKPHCSVSRPMVHLCLSMAFMEAEELQGALFLFHWHVENTFHTTTAHLLCWSFTEDAYGAVQLTEQIGPGWGWLFSVLNAQNSLCRLAGLWLRDPDHIWRSYTPVQQSNTKGTSAPVQQNSLSAKLDPAPDTAAGNTGSMCENRSSFLSSSLENRHQIPSSITDPRLSISKRLLI